ncbi:MAG TPA: LptA/OstA family protein [Polyangiaceae bacterium]|nr:LptA/OstA family protein [Polyangiaceae bacterium]
MSTSPVTLRRRCSAVLLAVAAVCSGAGTPAAPAAARPAPLAQKLEVQADTLDLDVARETLTLRGNVQARLGDLELSCPSVEARYDERAQLRSARCTAGASAKMKGFSATARSIDIDVLERRVQLQGDVRVVRGTGWLRAESATVDLATKRVSLNQVRGSIPLGPTE